MDGRVVSTFLSFLSFVSLNRLVRGRRVINSHPARRNGNKLANWSVSLVHAVICCGVQLPSMWTLRSQQQQGGFALEQSTREVALRIAPITMGYCLYDLCDLYRTRSLDTGLALHHLGVIWGCAVVLRTKLFGSFLVSALRTEFNSVHLQIRMLIILGGALPHVGRGGGTASNNGGPVTPRQRRALFAFAVNWVPLLVTMLWARGAVALRTLQQSVALARGDGGQHLPLLSSSMSPSQLTRIGLVGSTTGCFMLLYNIGIAFTLVRRDRERLHFAFNHLMLRKAC
jgi:hypothetical protein